VGGRRSRQLSEPEQLAEQCHPLVTHRHGVVHLVHVAAAVSAKLPAQRLIAGDQIGDPDQL
jgi:hypothetical protein